MKTWYYSTDGENRQGPVSESEIRDRLANNELTESTMVWTQGMEKWIRLAETKQFGTPKPPELSPEDTTPPALLSIPNGMRGWLLFFGMSTLGTGITQCLTLFGIASGIPLIIAGAALLAARTALEDPVEIDLFLAKMRTAIIGMSVVYILGLVMFLFLLLIIIPIFGAALATHGPELMQLFQP